MTTETTPTQTTETNETTPPTSETNTNVDVNTDVNSTETTDTTNQTEETQEKKDVTANKKVSQEDFNAVYFKMKQAERERDALKAQDTGATGAQPAQETQPAPAGNKAPVLEDFDYDESAYNQAQIAYQVQEQVNKVLDSRKTQDAASVQEKLNKEITQSFNTKAVEYAASNPDYEKAIAQAGNIQMSPVIQEVLLYSDKGPQLDHMLLSNPALIDKLNQMTPMQATMELGRLEQSVGTKTVQQSSAPDVIENNTGAALNTGNSDYNENCSMEEYYAAHEAKQK